jgi:hypothetical protein
MKKTTPSDDEIIKNFIRDLRFWYICHLTKIFRDTVNYNLAQ